MGACPEAAKAPLSRERKKRFPQRTHLQLNSYPEPIQTGDTRSIYENLGEGKPSSSGLQSPCANNNGRYYLAANMAALRVDVRKGQRR